MTARVQAGGTTKADMQRVKGRVLNAMSAVIEAKGAYESGLVQLKRLTGAVPSSIAIPGSLLPELPKDFETAMATAIQSNNELQAALQDRDSVVQERRSMQGKFAPKFDIELSAIHSYNAGGIAASDPTPYNPVYPSQNDKRAMLVMSWNLLDGGADLMQTKALEAKRLEYEYRARDIQRKLEESLRINFNTLRAVSGRINGVRQEIESNDIVIAAFNEQLFAANRSLLDVLDAYQRQYNSRTELARLLISEATASLEMLRNMGKLQEGIAALR
jgi:adhesin transport system outer membrane protein